MRSRSPILRDITDTARWVVKMDLSDIPARRALLARIAAPSRKAVVVTEGFLAYLAEEEVASLWSGRTPEGFPAPEAGIRSLTPLRPL